MLIACVQSDVTFADSSANLKRVLDWMTLASQAKGNSPDPGAELLVFPECMLTGYAFESREDAETAALTIDDPIFQTLAEAAGKYGQLLTIGFVESEKGRLFNSNALIGPGGVIGCYRKIHLPHLGVDHFVDRGDREYTVFQPQTAKGHQPRIGMAICYDGSFPEPIRVLALQGADIVTLGTNWPSTGAHTAEIVPRARAFENHLYFVAANRVGTENGFPFCGLSSICGPDGVVLAASEDDAESLLTADVDLALSRNKRIDRSGDAHFIDRFADRCPEFYGPISRAV